MTTTVYDEFEKIWAIGWEKTPEDTSILRDEPKPTPPQTMRIPLTEFSSGGLDVKSSKPIVVSIYYDEDSFAAESEALHLFATGESVDEAISEFNEQLIYFYNYYTSLSADAVTGIAVQLREKYENYFVVETATAA